jgi:SAM-dependent MidA family methyltransferase
MFWVDAWQDSLYGPQGFYRSEAGPRAHFSTATHGPTGRLLAEALLRLADEHGLRHVVDVGAGRGELLQHLYAARPALRLTGLDVVARPEGLPDPVE